MGMMMRRYNIDELKELRIYLGYSVEVYKLREVAQELCEQLMADYHKTRTILSITEKLERPIPQVKGPRRPSGKSRKNNSPVVEEEEGPDASFVVDPSTGDIRTDG